MNRRGRSVAVVVGERGVAELGSWERVVAEDGAVRARKAEVAQCFATIDDIALLPPIGPASRIFCLGLNYLDHAKEAGDAMPENPALFIKLAEALVGPDAPVIRPAVSGEYDYEGEIAVVIGRGGRHVSREDAMKHVLGYTIMLDGSIRDYQRHSIAAGKNFWRSGALGPWIVTADEIPDPKELSLKTRLNGVEVQNATADLMIYDIPGTIEYISRWLPLKPGDVIATGTPAGVGVARTPPLWMVPGDVIEVEVSAIGLLQNEVVAEHAPS